MKFVVAHTGARRGYAVPAILERAGMLEHFYTDICADVGLGRLVASVNKFGITSARLRRLQLRVLPANIIPKTRTFYLPNLRMYCSGMVNRDAVAAYRANLHWQCELGKRMADAGFGKATWLHSFLDEFPTLIIAAKERGLKVVSEIYILLSSDRLLVQERQEFPGWEEDSPDVAELNREILGENVLLARSDYALCPSEAVQDDLIRQFGFNAGRTCVVPYGVHDDWFQVRNEPVPGRVLFAGTADLRKGIHYLALAESKLRSRGRYHFRVAGNVHSKVAAQPLCRGLNFLGRVNRNKIKDEFARADVFVLPSLAEGSAGVTYEAMAAGVPVVATPEAGSVVRDGIDGRIVPSRDSDALADAIAEISEDRPKRERMATAARERARDFTWERYGQRLVAALKSIAERPA